MRPPHASRGTHPAPSSFPQVRMASVITEMVVHLNHKEGNWFDNPTPTPAPDLNESHHRREIDWNVICKFVYTFNFPLPITSGVCCLSTGDSNPAQDILAGCCHSNAHISLASGPGEQQNPGEKTLPLESRLRYTSGRSRLSDSATLYCHCSPIVN